MVVMAILASLLLNGGLLFWFLYSFKVDQLALAQNAGTVEGEQYLSIQLLSQSPSLETTTEVEVSKEGDPEERDPEEKQRDRVIDHASPLSLDSLKESDLQLIASTEYGEERVEVKEEIGLVKQVVEPIDSPPKRVKKGREKRESLESHHQHRADTKNLERGSIEPNKNLAPQNQNSKTESLSKEAPAVERGENEGGRGDQFAQSLMSSILHNIEGCYPEASKRRGEEGAVELALQLKNGNIEVILLKSSGYGRLDRCAIRSVEKALEKSQIKEVPSKRIKLKPIRFQLR